MTLHNTTNSTGALADPDLLCDKLLPNWMCYCATTMSLCVVLENILLVATICRGCSTSLSASSYTFLASLAAADALVGLTGTIFTLTYLHIYPEDGKLYLPSNLFSTTIIVAQTLMIISVLHMVVLALDRYVYILEPFFYIRRVTNRVIYGTIAITWFLGTLTMLLPSLYYISHHWEPFCEAIDTPTVFVVSMGTAYLIALVPIIYAYVMIFREVRRHHHSIGPSHVPTSRRLGKDHKNLSLRMSRNISVQGSQTSTASISESNANSSREGETKGPPNSEPEAYKKQGSWKSTMKIVKFLLLVFGAFTVCTMPSTICFLLYSIIPLSRFVSFLLISLLPLNSGLNFPILFMRDELIRKEFRRLVKDIAGFVRSRT